MQRYRSGHNEAVLKTVWVHARVGSNPTLCAIAGCQTTVCFFVLFIFFIYSSYHNNGDIFMNKKILKIETFGFIFTSVLGTLMHFFYEWSNDNSLIGLFCPVNESPFEHLKLLLFPYLIWTFIEAVKLSQDKFNIYFSKLIGIISGMFITLAVFYICKGMFGKDFDFINIASFFIGVLTAYIISYNILKSSKGKGLINGISFALLILMAMAFMFLTYFPVHIPFFTDPQDKTFGIAKQL